MGLSDVASAKKKGFAFSWCFYLFAMACWWFEALEAQLLLPADGGSETGSSRSASSSSASSARLARKAKCRSLAGLTIDHGDM